MSCTVSYRISLQTALFKRSHFVATEYTSVSNPTRATTILTLAVTTRLEFVSSACQLTDVYPYLLLDVTEATEEQGG